MNTGIQIIKPHVNFITPIHFPNWVEGFQKIIETCGRNCYQSEAKEGDTAERFIVRHLKHESIIEHGCFTVEVVCSRACSHQLVRHRLNSFAQESMRFCDYSSARLQKHTTMRLLSVILPPAYGAAVLDGKMLVAHPDEPALIVYNEGHLVNPNLVAFLQGCGVEASQVKRVVRWCQLRIAEYQEYLQDREDGIPSEDARFALPNATKTSVMMTCNFRQWRHILGHPVFGRALNKHAQWEIRELMLQVLTFFKQHVPSMFGDL